ncbi:hypothetical protein V1478_008019 [Vespula squamosa]|uniref:Uncharacterized protein n=1 Tax=Vespula squamosa TaxID=30214 RepID=A0ABD2AY79_VESSQ
MVGLGWNGNDRKGDNACRKVAQKKRSQARKIISQSVKAKTRDTKVNNFNVIHPLSPLAKLPEHSVPSLALPLLFSSMEASISSMVVTIGSTVSTRNSSSGSSNDSGSSSVLVAIVRVLVVEQ